MAHTIKVGDVEVVAMQDKVHDFTPAWHYPDVDEAAWEPYRDLLTGPEGYTVVNFGCFLVRADNKTILIDTGWGPVMGPPGAPETRGKLIDELASVGVSAEDVDIVALTHLHADHVGWLLDREGEGVKPMFGSARYLIPEADWTHYTSIDEMHPNIRQALDIGQFDVVDLIDDGHAVVPSLIAEATPGHTPGHTSFVVDSGRERLFILGDLVHHPAVADATEWVHRFDKDPAEAVAVRQRVLDRLERDGTAVAAGHLRYPSLGRFVRVDGRREWRPIT